MNSFYIDILIGVIFLAALMGFLWGEFIISSVLFAIAAIASNVKLNYVRMITGKFTSD
jgi:hypothetical protein